MASGEQTTLAASPLRVRHALSGDAAYIYFAGPIAAGAVARTERVSPDITLDFDADGRLLGIEILRSDLLHPVTIAAGVG